MMRPVPRPQPSAFPTVRAPPLEPEDDDVETLARAVRIPNNLALPSEPLAPASPPRGSPPVAQPQAPAPREDERRAHVPTEQPTVPDLGDDRSSVPPITNPPPGPPATPAADVVVSAPVADAAPITSPMPHVVAAQSKPPRLQSPPRSRHRHPRSMHPYPRRRGRHLSGRCRPSQSSGSRSPRWLLFRRLRPPGRRCVASRGSGCFFSSCWSRRVLSGSWRGDGAT